MKSLLTAILIVTFFSPSISNANTIVLDKKEVNAGYLNQMESSPAMDELTVKRGPDTPSKVKLILNFNYRQRVCSQWDSRDVWVPGNFHCTPHGGCSGSPGHWEQETFCVQWDRQLSNTDKKITLNFKNAARLSGNQEELFKIIVEQRSLDGRKLNLSGEVVSADRDYSISNYRTIFRKLGLKFSAR